MTAATTHKRENRPLRADALRNHERIIQATREILAEVGPDASMDSIATRAGVGVGTVYRRFPSKDALIKELVRLILDDLIAQARDCLSSNDGTGLHRFLEILGQSFVEHQHYAGELMKQTNSGWAQTLRELMAQLLSQAQQHQLVDTHTTPADITALAWALRGIVECSAAIDSTLWQRHLSTHLAGLRPDAHDPLQVCG